MSGRATWWLVVLAGAIALGLPGRAESAHMIIAVALVAALGVLFVLNEIAARLRRQTQWTHRVRGSLALLLAMLTLSLAVGAFFHHADVRAARSYCDTVIAQAETARQAGGEYPRQVDRPDTALPRLLDGEAFYSSDGDSFVVSFDERNGLYPTVHLYSSQRRTWTRF
jgi:hypothetical protein